MFKKHFLALAFAATSIALVTQGCASPSSDASDDEPPSTSPENAKDDGEPGKTEDHLDVPKIGKPCGPHKTWQCAPVIPIFCFIVCRDNLQH